MKRFLSLAIAVIMIFGTLTVAFAATSPEAELFVSIATKSGKLALAYEKIKVTDTDKDGQLTINDALYCAHDAKFDGKAAKGYGTSETQYGLSLTKLWGEENNMGFGYYLNNAAAWSLADKVKANDHVYAFTYTDTKDFSDTYSYFNKNTAEAEKGDEITLTLSMASFDENYNPVTKPVEKAEITIDGEGTGCYTDKKGNATFTAPRGGTYTVSAKSPSGSIITPPVCILTTTGQDASDIFNDIIESIKAFFTDIFSSLLSKITEIFPNIAPKV